ncbi:expansin-like B1 [Gastrolobium bilobum]|uniref:expansin-like B1 n=1 Tax=Gastrolobium bilobum TaxID=150636 RepID=UPI002AB26A46|nr:expansin-like B1 [Gastrolobium bilobum]
MELNFKHQLGLVCVTLLLPAMCTSLDNFTPSRATYYGSPDGYGNPRGACGFGYYGKTVNDGRVAGVSGLWKNGAGCGACYRVRCKIPQYCDEYGAYVVVTDYGEGDRTDFIMSPRGYSSLGRNDDASAELSKYGVVDVEYKRVPCKYGGNNNVLLKVHESSKNPYYLAILVLYVGGTYDVTAMELWQEDSKEWRPMRRAYGAVFDAANPPRGDIKMRFQVSGSAGLNWVESKNVISSKWKGGAVYDTQIQLD